MQNEKLLRGWRISGQLCILLCRSDYVFIRLNFVYQNSDGVWRIVSTGFLIKIESSLGVF